ncbi:ATP-binding protein [Herbivorax sp. ANBcel31]|uniref:ATP-binding protein n=1 Tax=Herbivorax sp. ANBcel31 TaxID=3069754 RepID=UPI0027B65465|nr:ATP-binding protein [Herbivorax sp. ANBcel31]MDQ2085461.1 ATP-binding protein [Herbivorax sp. ANBcel31]
MSKGIMSKEFVIPADDFAAAGEASSSVKKMLRQLGVAPQAVKKTAVSMYEAEMNVVIHAGGGRAFVQIDSERIVIKIKDEGPGIPDVDMAMEEGYSTASDEIREKGFGAGMGLPNIKRYSDKFDIITEVGKGTTVEITIFLA